MPEGTPLDAGAKEVVPLLPAAWFDAIYAGNAVYPFSNAGVATLLLNALLEKGADGPDLMKARTQVDWHISQNQADVFMKGMHAMHALYATPVAAYGRGKELEDQIAERHGHMPAKYDAREYTPAEVAQFCGGVLNNVPLIFDAMRDGLGAEVDTANATRMIKSYIGHMTRLFSKDKEIRKTIEEYQLAHQKYSMSSATYPRDADPFVATARKAVNDKMLEKVSGLMLKDPALISLGSLDRTIMVRRLNESYVKVNQRKDSPGLF